MVSPDSATLHPGYMLRLADPVDDPEIKRRYRELAMEHHPDRGGEMEKLQAINAAKGLLEPLRGR
ncbi:hypothetical protein SCT_0867 [Sulfuricella sp. T08]|uniref:J domain-containing protein n=1 Tax=Sulfuricella sp. T08 TaxID=1632857 RepID=UPI0006179FC1|nr:J domain-containing protein [Sulfuricella sp. T08]GAO35480.1 hypothetical protein SCT_0867 [Sulfuricella sp. T08]